MWKVQPTEGKLYCWVENEWNYTTTPCICLHVVDSNNCTFINEVRPNIRYKAGRIFCRQIMITDISGEFPQTATTTDTSIGSNQVSQHSHYVEADSSIISCLAWKDGVGPLVFQKAWLQVYSGSFSLKCYRISGTRFTALRKKRRQDTSKWNNLLDVSSWNWKYWNAD